jgi:hypothetical protein
VLLVTLDTTRADRIGAYGYGGAGTNTLDRLAEEGILFEQALPTAPITLPAHASLLTGVYPSAHGLHDNGIFKLSEKGTLIAEVLRRHGFRTGAFVGSFILDRQYGLDQGFEVYDGPRQRMDTTVSERPAGRVVDRAIQWIDTLDLGDDYFGWIHFYDPHLPWTPPDEAAQAHCLQRLPDRLAGGRLMQGAEPSEVFLGGEQALDPGGVADGLTFIIDPGVIGEDGVLNALIGSGNFPGLPGLDALPGLPGGDGDGLQPRRGVQLRIEVAHVRVDGVVADAHPRGDLLHRQPGDEQFERVVLARRQAVVGAGGREPSQQRQHLMLPKSYHQWRQNEQLKHNHLSGHC